MSILIDEDTRVLVQGLTGSEGSYHTEQMVAYGTRIVAGVVPGKGGQYHDCIPVYDTVKEAVARTAAECSVIFVPASKAKDAILEAADGGIKLIVCITEGIPFEDMLAVRDFLKEKSVRMIGPNCPGIIAPGQSKIGIMPGSIHRAGSVGVISRSGTLTYEAVKQLTDLEVGQSTVIGIGGDQIIGTSYLDLLGLFKNDPQTKAVLLIGEIGGRLEEQAADFISKTKFNKPVVAYIAGLSAPEGRRMGHAGAIISGGKGGAKDKIAYLSSRGIKIAESIEDIGSAVKSLL